MASCNCKGEIQQITENTFSPKKPLTNNVAKYFIKGIGFLLSLIALPIINLILIKILFQTIIMNKELDLRELISSMVLNKKDTKIELEYDDDDNSDIGNEGEYEYMNVEEIK